VSICLKILIYGHLSYCALLSQLHKRLVHGDANQPGRELGIPSESSQVLEGFKKGLLNCVLGIFPIMRDAVSDSEKFAIVSLHQLLESGNIPVLASLDKIEVIICLCSYSELS
jgi:hypothetical protein